MDIEELQQLKYSELQKIAKKHGVKANMKSDKIIQALCDLSNSGKNQLVEDESAATSVSESSTQSESDEKTMQVNTRKKVKTRKNRRKAKRSQSNSSDSESVASPQIKIVVCSPFKKRDSTANEKKNPNLLMPPKENLSESPFSLSNGRKRSCSNAEDKPPNKKRKHERKGTYEIEDENTPAKLQTPSQGRRQSGRNSSAAKASQTKRQSGGNSDEMKTPTTEKESIINQKQTSVKKMLASMSSDMDEQEMKKSLLSVLEETVKERVANGEKPTTQIPRFAAFAMKKKMEKKPITPGNKDWTKIHKRNFDKMESIDTYLQKKRRRNEEISESIKKAKLLADRARDASKKLKNSASKQPTALFKSPVNMQPFVPKVTSTSKMNLNFSTLKTPTNVAASGQRRSNCKTPVLAQSAAAQSKCGTRKSMQTPNNVTTIPSRRSKTPQNKDSTVKQRKTSLTQSTENKRTSGFGTETNTRETPARSEQKYNLNVTSTSKAKFDLKASLAKGMSWKPHKGKLQPFKTENLYSKPSVSHERDVKEVKIKTMADRRQLSQLKRGDSRLNLQMKRRGIIT